MNENETQRVADDILIALSKGAVEPDELPAMVGCLSWNGRFFKSWAMLAQKRLVEFQWSKTIGDSVCITTLPVIVPDEMNHSDKVTALPAVIQTHKSGTQGKYANVPSELKKHYHWIKTEGTVCCATPIVGVGIHNCYNEKVLKGWAKPIVHALEKVGYGDVLADESGVIFFMYADVPVEMQNVTRVTVDDGEIAIYGHGHTIEISGVGSGQIQDGRPALEGILQTHMHVNDTPQDEMDDSFANNDTEAFEDAPQNDISDSSANNDADTLQDAPQTHTSDSDSNGKYAAVPDVMKAPKQWVCWLSEERDGKPTKVPYQANPNRDMAMVNESRTWSSFQDAYKHSGLYTGIGFVLTKDDRFVGIDIDNCIDDNKNLKEWSKPIVDKLKKVGYGEVSPSGTGIKFWTYGVLPPTVNTGIKKPVADGIIEVYQHGRYFTVTGRGKGDVKECQPDIDWLLQTYLTPESRPGASKPKGVGKTQPITTDAHKGELNIDGVIKAVGRSKQWAKFTALMDGNPQGYGSHSEADAGLCGVLVFYTQDAGIIDTIFRRSKLMREKWDERHRADGATYGDMTIQNALQNKGEVYTPPKGKSKSRLYKTKKRYGG